MLLNTVTEKCYIGQTTRSLEDRWLAHRDSALVQSNNTTLCREIREYPEECWELAVLQSCTTQEELDTAEGNWIAYTHSDEYAVGYNMKHVATAEERLVRALLKINGKAIATKAGHTLEQFRAWGKKGARRREDMTPEEIERFREWGRKGAATSLSRGNDPTKKRRKRNKSSLTQ